MKRDLPTLVSRLAEKFTRSRHVDSVGPSDLAHFETCPQLLAKNKFVDPNRTARVEQSQGVWREFLHPGARRGWV